jgi:hypothetical protein
MNKKIYNCQEAICKFVHFHFTVSIYACGFENNNKIGFLYFFTRALAHKDILQRH